MSGTANRRRLEATTRMKLPARPEMPALSRTAADGGLLLIGGKHRRLDEPHQIITFGEHLADALQIFFDFGNFLFRFGQFEQGRGIALCHSGNQAGC